MNIQEHKNKIRSLSACSIPVMLAVAGWSAASGPAVVYTAQTHCESVPVAANGSTQTDNFVHVTVQSNADWLCISPDKDYFWVSRGADASISIYRFTDEAGNFELIEHTDATEFSGLLAGANAEGNIDLELSDDGEYLHQVFAETGVVGVYEIGKGSLSLVEVLVA